MMNWWCDKGIDGFRMDVISMISKTEDMPDGEIRGLYGDYSPYCVHQGFANTLNRHGIDPEGRCLPAGIFIKDGYDAAQRLLDAGAPLPDAIFCFNDPVAIGAMKALKNAGIRIPQDIAIVGFSEGSMATVVEPQLTTVQQPMHEMGRQAATLLLKQLHATRRQMPQTVCLDATLNIRDSSVAK